MQKIVLVGSGEFTPAMEEIDRNLLAGRGPVAIMPTAAGREKDWWKWVTRGVDYFSHLNIESFGIEVRDKKDAQNEQKVGEMKRATTVYFSGGDPGYLVEVIGGSRIWEEIKKKDIIVGSSAGAMLLGQWVLGNIYEVFEGGGVRLQWEKAMGVVPYTIWPHYNLAMGEFGEKWEWVKSRMPQEVRETSIGIDEETVMVIEDEKKPIVMGKGKVIWEI